MYKSPQFWASISLKLSQLSNTPRILSDFNKKAKICDFDLKKEKQIHSNTKLQKVIDISKACFRYLCLQDTPKEAYLGNPGPSAAIVNFLLLKNFVECIWNSAQRTSFVFFQLSSQFTLCKFSNLYLFLSWLSPTTKFLQWFCCFSIDFPSKI